MALDQTPIGTLTAELMEGLEQEFNDGEIGAVALVVEILTPDDGSHVASKFSDARIHVNLGLLEVASRTLTPNN